MTTSRSNLQGALYSLLTFHIGKVEVEGALLLVKLLAGVDEGWLVIIAAIQETDHIGHTVHPIHVELVYDSGLAHVLRRNNQPLELLFTGPDGHREHTADGFQFSVEPQFTNHHIVA